VAESYGIDIDQPELGAAELGEAEQVAQEVNPEDDAADADRDELRRPAR
jgi:hypothetical protein